MQHIGEKQTNILELKKNDDERSWHIFRYIRWGKGEKKCIYCNKPVKIHDTRKKGKQFLYRCNTKKCKSFTDLTQTPFNKTRLNITTLLFLVVLIRDGISILDASKILKIAYTSAFRYAAKIRKSTLCANLSTQLNTIGITVEAIMEYTNLIRDNKNTGSTPGNPKL